MEKTSKISFWYMTSYPLFRPNCDVCTLKTPLSGHSCKNLSFFWRRQQYSDRGTPCAFPGDGFTHGWHFQYRDDVGSGARNRFGQCRRSYAQGEYRAHRHQHRRQYPGNSSSFAIACRVPTKSSAGFMQAGKNRGQLPASLHRRRRKKRMGD